MAQTEEQVHFALGVLRKGFLEFMDLIQKLPGSPIQKQQAFLRFDEGHMWMQNSIVTYSPPAPQPAAPADVTPDATSQPVQEPVAEPSQTDAA